MKAINIEWDLIDDDCDIPTIVDLPKDLTEKLITDNFFDEKGFQTDSYRFTEIANYLSNEYGFCVFSFDVVKDFEELNEDELWKLREEVMIGSLFVSNYTNSFGYKSLDVSYFFDGYINYIEELLEEDGADDGEFENYDNIENLWGWFNCYDNLSWVRFEEE